MSIKLQDCNHCGFEYENLQTDNHVCLFCGEEKIKAEKCASTKMCDDCYEQSMSDSKLADCKSCSSGVLQQKDWQRQNGLCRQCINFNNLTLKK